MHLNLATGQLLNSSNLIKIADSLILDRKSGKIVLSNLLVPRAGALPTLFGDATLDLNFASSLSLDDAVSGNNLVTFSRASTGTYVGSDGLIKTSVVNLLSYSEEFDNISWSKFSSTSGTVPVVTPNYATAPDGTLTADRIVGTITPTIGSDWSLVRKTITTSGDHTWSIWLKSNTGSNQSITINYVSPTGTVTVTPEWQRFSLTTTQSSFECDIGLQNEGSRVTDYSMDILAWGAQLQEGALTDYIPTTTTIGGAPRFDHDPVTGESLGLLIEESRTNLLAYSSDTTNAVWSSSRSTETIGGTAPDGSNTANDVTVTISGFNGSVNQTLTVVGDHAFSVFVKKKGFSVFRFGSTVNTPDYVNWNIDTNTFSNQGTNVVSASSTDVGDGWYRISVVFNIATQTAYAFQVFVVDNPGNTYTTVNGTDGFYMWGAQVEAGSFPTSYIPTTTSAVTRAADLASIEGTNFSSWYNQSEGTVFSISSSVTNLQASTSRDLYTIYQDSSNKHGFGYRGNLNDFVHQTLVGGSRQFSPVDAGDPTYTNDKNAYSYSNTGGSTVHNSQEWSSSTSDLSVINPTILYIGGIQNLNGHISRLAYFPTRKTDQELIDLTT